MDLINKLLTDFPCHTRVEVQWADMDAAQHVSNVMYLRWGEIARIDYLQKAGWENISNPEQPGIILAYQDIKYIYPLTFPDTVIMGSSVTDVAEDRFTMLCHMVSQKHQRLCAIAHFLLVTYDYQKLQKTSIPADLASMIRDMENKKRK